MALNLYCKIPFNRVGSRHPDIIRIAKIIGRSPNPVKTKIGNFGGFDPELKERGVVGLSNSSKLDNSVWDEFNQGRESLAYESELLIATSTNTPIELFANINLADIPEGKERDVIIKTRVNQAFFQSTTLSSYNLKCCVTGLSIPAFLEASHIVPWSQDEKNRLNPHNGLCLNHLHHKAFDSGFIGISPDYRVVVSSDFDAFKKALPVSDLFLKYADQPIFLPDKFLPSKEFLARHHETIFRK